MGSHKYRCQAAWPSYCTVYYIPTWGATVVGSSQRFSAVWKLITSVYVLVHRYRHSFTGHQENTLGYFLLTNNYEISKQAEFSLQVTKWTTFTDSFSETGCLCIYTEGAIDKDIVWTVIYYNEKEDQRIKSQYISESNSRWNLCKGVGV